jgi:hypothetical protein
MMTGPENGDHPDEIEGAYIRLFAREVSDYLTATPAGRP